MNSDKSLLYQTLDARAEIASSLRELMRSAIDYSPAETISALADAIKVADADVEEIIKEVQAVESMEDRPKASDRSRDGVITGMGWIKKAQIRPSIVLNSEND